MKDKCIIRLIEETTFARLSEADLTVISVHIETCVGCRDAFQAAQVSAVLLHERADAEIEPSPFFQTRVMARWRERQAEGEQWAWSRLWRSAGALASSMAATVAALAVLTFVIPATEAGSQVTSLNGDFAERVLLDQSATLEDDSEGQLLTTIYGEE